MGNLSHSLLQLHALAGFLDIQGNLEQSLNQLAEMAAKILNARHCSIMLLDEAEKDELKLRVFAAHGDLPEAAYKQITQKGEGISGHVLATGQPLLIADIEKSEFAGVARRLTQGSQSLISAPIVLRRNIVGVINITDPISKRPFNLDDLHLLDVVALFVAKSLQVTQLESILNSRFAQMALAQEAKHAIGDAMSYVSENPNQLAKILAKSFFKEMSKAGFTATQIIHAASEIITQLNADLTKHSKRLQRTEKE
jgi:L-methionine (R)-S-oxide reductase